MEAVSSHGTIQEVAEHLGISDNWARACIEAQMKRRRLDDDANARGSTEYSEDAVHSATLRSEVDKEALRGLLDLHNAGMAVVWPRGFDQITARAYLQEYDNL